MPVDVPGGIVRLQVRYGYSHKRDAADQAGLVDGNTLDIGIFDPRGHEFSTAQGFRGWSGSDRAEFSIGETESTPGYLAGSILPGQWHIILGLYHIAPEGCDYQIEVTLTSGVRDEQPIWRLPLTPQPAINTEARWYRGDLQCHTHHSDAAGSLATLVATAQTRGLDFLAVTDHNTITHIREFPHFASGPLLLIPATEVTTYRGHMNVWGLREWQEFRSRDDDAMREIIAAAHQQGALVSINHPKDFGPPWEYGDDLDVDCMEVWQAPWPYFNAQSLRRWESLLLSGRHIVAVGGSDYHQPLEANQPNPHLLGHPTTWVFADELSVVGILAGIRHGRVSISADIDGSRVELSVQQGMSRYQMGDVVTDAVQPIDVTCHVIGAAGCVLRLIADGVAIKHFDIDNEDWIDEITNFACPARYVRAEVMLKPNEADRPDDRILVAMSNSIYFAPPS